MHYKTMVLHLLEDHPRFYEQLRQARTLRPTLDRLASELKASHEAQKVLLSRARPGSESQIASEALEIALQQLKDSLPSESPPDEDDQPSLDAVMAFLLQHMPPG